MSMLNTAAHIRTEGYVGFNGGATYHGFITSRQSGPGTLGGTGGDTTTFLFGDWPDASSYSQLFARGYVTASDAALKSGVVKLDPHDVLAAARDLPVYVHEAVGAQDHDAKLIRATPAHRRRARTHDLSVMAHEVAERFPEAASLNAEHKPVGVDYGRLAVVALAGMQALADRVEELEGKLEVQSGTGSGG
jgi:hypothetical protein